MIDSPLVKGQKMVLGYITCTHSKEAQSLALALLKNKLIACANIQDSIQSFYHSQKDGQDMIENTKEAVLIVKTSQEYIKAVIDLVKKLHSYDCPCIIFYKVIDGYSKYISWVKEQTKPIS